MKKVEGYMAVLCDYLNASSRISLSEASLLLNVSESTARRLFTRLEQTGKAIRIHGGLQRIPEIIEEYSFEQAETKKLLEKKSISQAVISEIEGCSSIYLDSGSTVLQVSVALANFLRGKETPLPTIFTNSLRNMAVLTDVAPIQLIGGMYRIQRRDFCGFIAEHALKQLHFDICILGTDGCKISDGFTTTDFDTAKLNEIVITRSSKKIVVADATKFTTGAMIRYAQIHEIDKIYTDASLLSTIDEPYNKLGVKIVRAK